MKTGYLTKDLLCILLAVFLLAFGMSFVSPLIPLLLKDLQASSASIGQIQTAYFLTFTVVSLFLGRWIDTVGSKKIIIFGLLIYSVSIGLMPWLPTPGWFYLLRLVQGVGSAFLFAPTEAAINIIAPAERRGSVMGLYALVFAGGFALGPVGGASLFVLHMAAPFMIAATLCAAAAVVLMFGYTDHPIALTDRTQASFSALLKKLTVPLAAAVSYAFVEISLASFLSLYLDSLNIRGYALGIVFTFFAIGGVVSPFPAGRLADRFGKHAVLKACGVILLGVTGSFNIFQGYIAICLLTFAVGLVAGALYPVALAVLGEVVPKERMGSANAAFSFFYGAGSVAGPLITGWVIELTSLPVMFYPMAAVSLLFVIVAARAPGGLPAKNTALF
jgi:MFS family permease